MLYFWILTVLLFALPIGLAVLTWNQSQADARASSGLGLILEQAL